MPQKRWICKPTFHWYFKWAQLLKKSTTEQCTNLSLSLPSNLQYFKSFCFKKLSRDTLNWTWSRFLLGIRPIVNFAVLFRHVRVSDQIGPERTEDSTSCGYRGREFSYCETVVPLAYSNYTVCTDLKWITKTVVTITFFFWSISVIIW